MRKEKNRLEGVNVILKLGLLILVLGLGSCSSVVRESISSQSSESARQGASEPPSKEWIEAALAVLCDPTASLMLKHAYLSGGDLASNDQALLQLSDVIKGKSLAPITTSIVGMMVEDEVGNLWSVNILFRSENAEFPPHGTPIQLILQQVTKRWVFTLDSFSSIGKRFQKIGS
ncbi:MAG: hypothetical protein ACRCSF_10525 [Mycobacteriaceae bacterium]